MRPNIQCGIGCSNAVEFSTVIMLVNVIERGDFISVGGRAVNRVRKSNGQVSIIQSLSGSYVRLLSEQASCSSA